VAFLDLIQEGNLGLIKAIENYEIGMAPRLANYAQWSIRQKLIRTLDKFGHSIHVPKKVLANRKTIDIAIDDLLSRTSRSLTYEDISEETGLSISEITNALELPKDPISLATQIGPEGEELLELLSDMPQPETDNEIPILTDVLQKQIEKSLKVLEPHEREVIVAIYGLEGGDLKTANQIADQLGLAPERVRQIEVKAMSKLRHPSRSNPLSMFSED
jgi:RNA polymerase primary sigma factor